MESKKLTNTARAGFEIWNIGLFAFVWCTYYNKFVFHTKMGWGAALSVLIYAIIYNAISSVYRAHRIASTKTWETVFTQTVSFGIADLLLYLECSLVHGAMLNLIPGIQIVCLQILGSLGIVALAKYCFLKRIPPQKTVFVYGNEISEDEIHTFKKQILEKYAHLFDVREVISENTDIDTLHQHIAEADTVLFYEVSYDKRTSLAEYAVQKEKVVYLTPNVGDLLLTGCQPRHLLDTPLLRYGYAYQKKSLHIRKRIFDIVLSFAFLVCTSPIMLITAIAIKLEDGGPVFYKQARYTKDAKVFDILKFRSMIVDAEKNGFIPCASGDKRITKVGKFIRSTRIDELPQIINILKGDMSFVGPRPERIEHVQKYTEELPEFEYRMRVKGGLTGYAQIYGKYNTSAYDKLRLDLMYIENQSFLLDLKILMLTFKVVFTPESTEGFTEEKSQSIAAEGKKVVPMGMYSKAGKDYNV